MLYVDEATTVTRRSAGKNMTSLQGSAKLDFKKRIIAGVERIYTKWPAVSQRQQEFRELFLELETTVARWLASGRPTVDFEWLHLLYEFYDMVADSEMEIRKARTRLSASCARLLTSGSIRPQAATLAFSRSAQLRSSSEA